MSVKATQSLTAIQELYDFFTGGDNKMAAPLAKVFLCLCVLMGVALYTVSTKYFTLLESTKTDLIEAKSLVSKHKALEQELDKQIIINDGLRKSLGACKLADAVSAKPADSYNVPPPKVINNNKMSHKRLAELINQ